MRGSGEGEVPWLHVFVSSHDQLQAVDLPRLDHRVVFVERKSEPDQVVLARQVGSAEDQRLSVIKKEAGGSLEPRRGG